MWNAICLFMIIITGVTGTSDQCNLHSYLVCGVDDVPELFPGTEKELYRACKAEIRFLKCVIRTERRCQTDPDYIRMHVDFLSAVKEMCDKDSPTHPVVLDNLKCVKPIFDKQSKDCLKSYPGNRKMRKYTKTLVREGISAFTKDKDDRKECLHGLHILTCESLKLEGECGTAALEAFIDIVYTRTRALTERCNAGIKNHLLDIVRTVQRERDEYSEDEK